MEKKKLDKILKKHAAWLNDKDGGERADLSGADLSDAAKNIVWCGCFKGTFEEWVVKIRETYPDENNVYRKEYEAAIVFFKTVAEANEEKSQNG